MREVLWISQDVPDLAIRLQQWERHRVVVDRPRGRLGEFPVDDGQKVEFIVDEDVLRAEIHVVQGESPIAISVECGASNNVAKHKRAQGGPGHTGIRLQLADGGVCNGTKVCRRVRIGTVGFKPFSHGSGQPANDGLA